jgi:hypothetical protein
MQSAVFAGLLLASRTPRNSDASVASSSAAAARRYAASAAIFCLRASGWFA